MWLICLCVILYSLVWHNVSLQILQLQNALCCFGKNGPEKLDFILLSSLFPVTCHIKKITATSTIKSWISGVWKQRTSTAKSVWFSLQRKIF